ncbi:recombinase family protein [Parafrankia sp. BMG5.11]|uniref:recombinase family protein n=1 Tax=Parafrankia sp. BMG5.11 TaxID=222540 RepID=UPI00103B528C|nr:recombinase family protein [Parafrankia sp. BMG5.11]TCJ32161.1 recombinase family protein [Parafrankia sp. BMG5.11]
MVVTVGDVRQAARLRAGTYSRDSDDPAGGRSVASQDDDSTRVCEREGWTIVRRFTDQRRGASRFSANGGRGRPDFDAMVKAIRSGELDILVTTECSRFMRDLAVYAELAELCRRAGVLWCYNGRVYDLADEEDEFQTGLDALLAVREAGKIAKRVRRGMRSQATNGKYHGGGNRPYGWRRTGSRGTAVGKLIPVPREQEIIRELTLRVIRAGERDSCRHLALELRQRWEPTAVQYRTLKSRDGKVSLKKAEWTAERVRNVVLRAMNAGLREHHGELYRAVWGREIAQKDGTTEWGCAVTRSEWEAACAILRDPERRTNHSPAERYLLSGIATCPDGHFYWSAGLRNGILTYACGVSTEHKNHLFRQMRKTDDLVYAVLCGVWQDGVCTTPGLLARENLGWTSENDPVSVTEMRAKVDALRKSRDQLEDALAGYPVEELKHVRKEGLQRNLQRTLADLEKEEEKLTGMVVPDVTDGLEDISEKDFRALPIAVQREVVRALLTVTILPTQRGSRFNPDAIIIRERRRVTLTSDGE